MTEITTVYRGRRFTDFSAMDAAVKAFQEKQISELDVFAMIRDSQDGWKTYYEPCPVIGHRGRKIIVESETIPDSPFYPGGKFHLDLGTLLHNNKVYHSRHGEWFYLQQPTVSEPWFPCEVVRPILSETTP